MSIGDLAVGEPHPAARSAFAFIKTMPDQAQWAEAFASLALSGNRHAEILGETLRRVMEGEPVSDRYILGLAWWIVMSMDAYGRGVRADES